MPVVKKSNLKVTLLEICKTQKRVSLVYLVIVYFFVCLINHRQINITEKRKL